MSRISILLILLFCVSASPAERDVLWNSSLQSYQRGDFQASRNTLLRLVKIDPNNALAWFNLGNSYFMLKQYAYAETSFYKVETLRSKLTPAAQLYRAKALKERGETTQSRALLQALLKSKLPSGLHDEATHDLLSLEQEESETLKLYKAGKYKRALRILQETQRPTEDEKMLKALILIKLEREDAAADILSRLKRSDNQTIQQLAHSLESRIRNNYSKPKWLFAEAAFLHETNLYQSSDSTSGNGWAANAGGGGRLWSEGLWYLTAGYTGRFRDYFSHADLQAMNHEARLSFGREAAANLLQISAIASHDSWDGKARRFSKGLGMRMRGGDEGIEFGLDSEVTYDESQSTTQNYLDGSTQSYVVYAGMINEPLYTRAFISFGRVDIGDQTISSTELLPQAHRYKGLGVRVLWRPVREWIAETQIGYMTKSYATPARPRNELRDDKEASLSARVTRILSPILSTYGSVSYIRHNSTLGSSSVSNENYNDLQFMAGAVWEAF